MTNLSIQGPQCCSFRARERDWGVSGSSEEHNRTVYKENTAELYIYGFWAGFYVDAFRCRFGHWFLASLAVRSLLCDNVSEKTIPPWFDMTGCGPCFKLFLHWCLPSAPDLSPLVYSGTRLWCWIVFGDRLKKLRFCLCSRFGCSGHHHPLSPSVLLKSWMEVHSHKTFPGCNKILLST